MIMVFSTGMYHAAVAMLPSSFAMMCAMLGMTAFIDWRGKNQTARGIMWFGIGAIVGWPFAGALVLPFLLEEVVFALISSSLKTAVMHVLNGGVRCLLVLVRMLPLFPFPWRRHLNPLTPLPGTRNCSR